MKSKPIQIHVKSASTKKTVPLATFSSYSFDRNILIPASPFRFTAEGVDKADRIAIRSGDLVQLFIPYKSAPLNIPLATGYIDETDMHLNANALDYVLTGRDTIGVLVDNAAIDKDNNVIFIKSISLADIVALMMQNTRLQSYGKPVSQQAPNGNILLQTNPGETKINAIQRYLEYTNCLLWSNAAGQPVLGKPNMTQRPLGTLIANPKDKNNNILECRVKRNTNNAIRIMASQMQNLESVNPAPITMKNQDRDVLKIANDLGGRSVYRVWSLGNGMDAVNNLSQVGQGNFNSIGHQLTLREIARENMKVLDVEAVVEGHINDSNIPYAIDQIYNIKIDDESVDEPMYVYACRYDLTKDRGMLTTLRLCRLGSIVYGSSQLNFGTGA